MKVTEETREKIYYLCEKYKLDPASEVRKFTGKERLLDITNLEGKQLITYLKLSHE